MYARYAMYTTMIGPTSSATPAVLPWSTMTTTSPSIVVTTVPTNASPELCNTALLDALPCMTPIAMAIVARLMTDDTTTPTTHAIQLFAPSEPDVAIARNTAVANT